MAIQMGDIVDLIVELPQDKTVPGDEIPVAARVGKFVSEEGRSVIVELEPVTTDEDRFGAKFRILKGKLKPKGSGRWVWRGKISEMR